MKQAESQHSFLCPDCRCSMTVALCSHCLPLRMDCSYSQAVYNPVLSKASAMVQITQQLLRVQSDFEESQAYYSAH